jgi:hypothetical protein
MLTFQVECNFAKIFSLSRVSNYLSFYIVEYSLYRKTFPIKVVDSNEILCYVRHELFMRERIDFDLEFM